MKKLILITIISTQTVMAGCFTNYQAKAGRSMLSAQFQGTAVGTATSIAGGALVTGTAPVTGGATILVAAGAMAISNLTKLKYKKVSKLLFEANYGDGPSIRKLQDKLEAKGVYLKKNELSKRLLEFDKNNTLCPYNPETGKIELYSYKEIISALQDA